MEYKFTLVLDNVSEIGERLENQLFESGCGDALLSLQAGVCSLNFTREAPNLGRAVLSAIEDVRNAGYSARMCIDD